MKDVNELLGTKLRAIYQRSKGRDLFDIYYSNVKTDLDFDKILFCYRAYMKFSVGKIPTFKEFLINLKGKEHDPGFKGDMEALLRIGIEYNQEEAFEWIKRELVIRMKK